MLGDDIMDERSTVLADMIGVYEERECAVVAVQEVGSSEISNYGSIDPEVFSENLVRLRGIVEKPTAEDAPSNLAVMGRYVFTPEIFDVLDQVKPGVGGEIQLTDAIALLLSDHDVFGWVFSHGRFDIGNKQDYLRATVELAIEREDLGPEFRAFLIDLVDTRLR